MTQEQAEWIAYHWKYEDEYSFYDMAADPEDLKDFLDEKQRGFSYYVVYKHHEVRGYFVFNTKEIGVVHIGLGMRPERTGKGEGIRFL
ncbi:hypothetical protein ACTHPF_02265 [Paenibacillus sp. SAF-054]|uniref:hypothetical protein n=1 Tax=unclassified Paenibacillus TaxID=185978 RepID=UPI003F810397